MSEALLVATVLSAWVGGFLMGINLGELKWRTTR